MRRHHAILLALIATALFFATSSPAQAYKIAPSKTWTIDIAGKQVGLREWREPDFSAAFSPTPTKTSASLPIKIRTEILIGDFRKNVPARAEFVAGGLGLLLVFLIVAAGNFSRQMFQNQKVGDADE
ncbi:MAG: hypothetical protein HKN23_05970 [Verrucomicrobiales bacterium]|nr:hypothetical protein [Verrucomicrobiales bacterium]